MPTLPFMDVVVLLSTDTTLPSMYVNVGIIVIIIIGIEAPTFRH